LAVNAFLVDIAPIPTGVIRVSIQKFLKKILSSPILYLIPKAITAANQIKTPISFLGVYFSSPIAITAPWTNTGMSGCQRER